MKLRSNSFFSRGVLIAIAVVVALLAVQSVRLGREVLFRLDGLSTAATDSLQWTLSQAEIEHLKLENAVLAAETVEDLAQVRRKFDILFSRIMTIRESRTFAPVRNAPDNAGIMPRVQQRIDYLITYIDGPDEALLFGLPRVSEILEENRTDLRNLALAGLTEHARASEEKRLNFFDLLSRLAIVVLALLVALTMTTLMMGRLYQRGKRLAERTREAVARMRAMVTSSLDAILVVDSDGKIQEFNGAAEAIFGYSRAEATGANMADLIVPDHLREAHAEGMERFRTSGQETVIGKGRIQLEAKRKSGEVFPVELSITASKPAEDGEEGETVFVSYLRDISDRIAAERELRNARDKALAGERAKAELLTVMSHEMRTPLTGVLGAVDLLSDSGLSAEQSGYVTMIRQSGDRLMGHVNDVLQLSNLESSVDNENRRIFDLAKLVGELVKSQQTAARQAGNELSWSCNLGPTNNVLGRPLAVQRVLQKILQNAVDFTRDGAVAVEVQRLGSSDRVEISIADTGKGIAEDDLDRIFEDFIRLDASYSRSSEGTGLGLAITRRTVEAMGGDISCESELGEGSLFTISLPLPASGQSASNTTAPAAPAAAADTHDAVQKEPQAAASVAEQQDPQALDILVVEDNEINRILVEKMLRNLGHRVTLAPGGAEGVAAARDKDFNLIFMDISMPGVDGIEATRQIRNGHLADGVDIVALTAHVAPQDHARILAAGMAEVVTKPVHKSTLADVIDRRATLPLVRSRRPVAKAKPTAKLTAAAQTPEPAPAAARELSDIEQFFDALGRDRGVEFLAEYKGDMEQLLADLHSCEDLSDPLRAEAHRLAGSAAVLGFGALRHALLDIENADGNGGTDLMRLQAEWDEAQGEITSHLAA
ncbi:PAS domain-containing hybrid sensor histidine kinase/response regulator [Phaeobacter italicus]|uniref:PAS domain-containing hybrid sensor histidine kinase/response regulator n=1 Tax=Phaeobacter italicus TaxID=481446 RepID=UPI0024303ED8|nr:PAS domain-containing hybrid sensor histidine kinase/response regulator [Phaeobacter italicus]MCI5101077.1 PAS domain S-box protein [Phaeobacter italicus]